MSVLSGILHGSVPAGRAQNDQFEGHNGGHAETAARLPHQLRSDTSAHPDRQRPRDTGERQDRATHHEVGAGRVQSVCSGQGSGHPDRKPVLQAEADAGQEGREQEQCVVGALTENQ